jgi:hypothetical protein
MCHPFRVQLSAEEKATAKRLIGVMVPIYVAAALAIVALVALGAPPHAGVLVASASAPVAPR